MLRHQQKHTVRFTKDYHGLALPSYGKQTPGSQVEVRGLLDPSTTPPPCPIGTLQLLILHCYQQHCNLTPSNTVSYQSNRFYLAVLWTDIACPCIILQRQVLAIHPANWWRINTRKGYVQPHYKLTMHTSISYCHNRWHKASGMWRQNHVSSIWELRMRTGCTMTYYWHIIIHIPTYLVS